MDGTRGNRSDLTIDGVRARPLPPRTRSSRRTFRRRHRSGIQGPDGHVRRRDRQYRRGVTNLVIKSGTNKLRGTIYIAKTPGELFANDFFANANNIPLAPFSLQPLRRDGRRPDRCCPATTAAARRSSCMGSRASTSRGRATTARRRCRPRRRTGDFSELLALGSQYQIYNPFTRRAIAGGRFQQDPFPATSFRSS